MQPPYRGHKQNQVMRAWILYLTLLQEYRTILQHDIKNLRSSLKSVIFPAWTSTDRKKYPGQFRLYQKGLEDKSVNDRSISEIFQAFLSASSLPLLIRCGEGVFLNNLLSLKPTASCTIAKVRPASISGALITALKWI